MVRAAGRTLGRPMATDAASSTRREKPELLAPAGDWECLRAAVVAGADAVYFGLPVLNARLRADNFTVDDLPAVVSFLHEHGVRAHLTLNTLVFTSELAGAEALLRAADGAGVDAIIVQDLGLVRAAREIAPRLEVHASTQMTITSAEGVRFARRLGVSRVVLARELSTREIEKLRGDDLLPLEVFVHGALCVAYSGQCLTSESLGQRSANRGECAQACRMPYDLIADGRQVDLGDRKYLLSPQDLCAVDEIPALVEQGIACFKIEGRLKSPEYVAAVTRVYRKAIDAAFAHRDGQAIGEDDRYELEMTFSRGLYTGWLRGVHHQELVHARFGKRRGPFVGFVERSGTDWVELAASPRGRLARGDGIVFDTGGDTEHEQGGRVYEVRDRRLEFERGRFDPSRLAAGTRVWKTDDPRLTKRLRVFIASDLPRPRRRLDIRVGGAAGEPLVLTAEVDGRVHEVRSSPCLASARTRPLDDDTLSRQLGRLGGTDWELGRLENRLEGAVMIPLGELNRLRRDLVASLAAAESALAVPAVARTIGRADDRRLDDILRGIAGRREAALRESARRAVELVVLCRSLEQLEETLALGVERVYCDLEDPRRYREAVARTRAVAGAEIFLATPRIQKAGEKGLFQPIELAEPDGVLVRNLGASHHFRERGLRRVADFSLNVANPITADVLMAEGFERLTLSYDLDAQQVLALLEIAPPDWFEATLHQHMPMFHMEHCLFAAFLSTGKDHTDCGRPCDRHRLAVRDRVGISHPVTADVGCRNTVFNAQAQSGAAYFDAFRRAGVFAYRVELLDEDRDAARETVASYRDLVAGRLEVEALIRRLRVHAQLGVTRGTLSVHGGTPDP